jgi:putative ABC transport system permease protein
MQWDFLWAWVLVGLALLYAHHLALGVERSLLIASIAAFFQLLLLGFVLSILFALEHPLTFLGVFIGMSLFGAFTAHRRVNLGPGSFLIAFFTLLLASALVISVLLITGVIKPVASQLIPILGMVVGNALNIYTLAIERALAQLRLNRPAIEGRFALGATPAQALHDELKEAAKAGLIPIMNNLKTVGIVWIPGITVGMLLAGADPLTAVSYQLAIMYMMVGVSLFTLMIGFRLGRSRLIPVAFRGQT